MLAGHSHQDSRGREEGAAQIRSGKTPNGTRGTGKIEKAGKSGGLRKAEKT